MDEREFDRRRNSSPSSRNNDRSGAARDQPSEFPSAEVGASAAYPGVLVPISRGSDVGLHPDPPARFQCWRPVDEPISHSGGRRVTFDYAVAENPTDIVRYGQHARDGMRASSHHSNPEYEHVSERSGREHRLRSLPDIGLLRRIFKKRTVTTTVDEYEPDIGEYPGPRATTPDYIESSSPRYDPEDQILDRYSDGRRRLSIQQTGDAAVYRVDERPMRPASRRGAGVRKYSQPNVDYGIAREETQIPPTREWRLQSEPNTGTLQRTTHNRNFDTEARYYSEGADFSHASRWRITDMRHAPSPHQIVGHEAVFDTERNTILIPARDTLRNDTLAHDRQGNITMHQLPAHGVVVDGGSRWRDGETGFERLERRPSAVEFKDVRKHSEPIALYRGEAPDISRSEQRSQSLGIESLRLVRDTFAQRRHASQNHSVDPEKQPMSLDLPQRERNRETSDAAGDLRQSTAGELGPTSTSLSDGARPPKITGATGTDHTEGILRNRKSNKAGLSKSKSLDQGDPIQEKRRVRWSSLPELDKPDGGDPRDSGLGRRTRSASTTGELGDFWYVDDVGESFGPEASDKQGEGDDVEKQLKRAPKPGRRKSILEELRLVGIPVYVYKGLFSAAVGIILCFITAYLFFPDQADSETARVARVFTTPGILVAFAYTFYAVKYRDSAW